MLNILYYNLSFMIYVYYTTLIGIVYLPYQKKIMNKQIEHYVFKFTIRMIVFGFHLRLVLITTYKSKSEKKNQEDINKPSQTKKKPREENRIKNIQLTIQIFFSMNSFRHGFLNFIF